MMRRLLTLILLAGCGLAQAEPLAPPTPIPSPEVARRQFNLPAIDTEDLELAGYWGMMGVEDFGTSALSGVSLALHPVPRWFLEASVGRAAVRDSDFRRLGIALFPQQRERLEVSTLVAGFDLLPGEVYPTRQRAWVSAFYVLGGGGLTRFAGQRWFHLTAGLGLRLLPTDWLALHAEGRAHQFRGSLLGAEKYAHNVELRLVLAVFF